LKEYWPPDLEITNRDGEYILNGYLRMSGATSADGVGFLLQMVEDGASVYQASPYYNVPKAGVEWLATRGADVVKALVAAGVIDINRQDDRGNTFLHLVCAYNVNYNQEAAKGIYQKVKLLLEAGADASIVNDKEETPMMLAAGDNLKVKTVELLLQHKNN